MSATRYLPGTNRRFNDHSVCLECGAMIDNDFVGAHDISHGHEPEADLTAKVRREADELRAQLSAPTTWEPIPKGARRRFRPFRLRQ